MQRVHLALGLVTAAWAWDCTLPGLDVFSPGQYDGVQVNYLSAVTSTSSPQFADRAREFEACTGARIVFAEAENVFEDPIKDIGTRSAEGQQLYDAYLMSYSHFPEASALGLPEPLNDRIAKTNDRLKWEDFFPQVRTMGQFRRSSGTDVDFLMFDGDFFVPIIRLDLYKKYDLPLPQTWEDVVEQASFFHGKDLNDDGIPDFGFCHFPRIGAGVWDWWWAEAIYSTWASMAQTGGTGDGFFFDLETFDPKVDSESFREAAKFWKQMWNLGEEGCISDNMATGRCAIGYSPPGCWKGIFLNGVGRKDVNGSWIWQPTIDGQYVAPYRALPFGSLKVQDGAARLQGCTEELCPKAKPVQARGHVSDTDRASILRASPHEGKLINRAPFYWSGGFGTMIRKSADPTVKDAVWDFFVYINSPDTSVHDVASYSSWIDSWRFSQLSAEGPNFVVESSWPVEAYQEHRSAMWDSLGSDSNGALNLRIPGIKDYTFEVMGGSMTKYINDEITLDELVEEIRDGWNKVSVQRGIIDQLQTYRATLGQARMEDFDLCRLHRPTMDGIDPRVCRAFDEDDGVLMIILMAVGSVLGAILFLGLVVWVIQNFRTKLRLQKKERERQQKVVSDALESLEDVAFPMVIVEGGFFSKLGCFKSHEAIRDDIASKSAMRWLDTMSSIFEFRDLANKIVFYSHQWLAYTSPDPFNAQYVSAVQALGDLIVIREWDMSSVFIWADMISIAQANKNMQRAAISSLPIYASNVDAFVILAPEAKHKDTGHTCSTKTYQRRAWCRAEILSHSLRCGVENMYLMAGKSLEKVALKTELMAEALYVFEGELTCCRLKHKGMDMCDRERLMMPFLALYGCSFAEKPEESGGNDVVEDFKELVLRDEHRLFPSDIDVDCGGGRPKRVPLFRGLLPLMKATVMAMGDEELVEKKLTRNSVDSIRSRHSSASAV